MNFKSPFVGRPDNGNFLHDFPILLILAGLSILHVGYRFGSNDMVYYLPLIKRAADPSFLRNDWFLSTVHDYHASFVYALAAISRFADLEIPLFLLHLAERILLVFGIYSLSMAMFRRPLAACLAAWVAVYSCHWNLGGNPFVASVSIPHTLAIVSSIFALRYSMLKSYRAAALLASVTTYLHILIGTEVMLIMWLNWLMLTETPRKALWSSAALYTALAFPILAPVVMSQIQSVGGTELTATQYIEIAGRLRHPWHYIPTSWAFSAYAVFFSYLAASAASFYASSNAIEAGVRRQVMNLTATLLVLCVVGTVFVEFWPISLVFKLQFFRMTIFIRLLGSLLIAQSLADSIESRKWWRVGLCLLALARVGDAFQFWALFGLLSSLELALSRLGTASGGEGPNDLTRNRIGAAARAGLLVALHLVLFVTYQPTGSLLDKVQLNLAPRDDWEMLCVWVRENTPPGGVFITPPYKDDFRARAERAIVVDFKGFSYAETEIVEWKNRLLDLTNGAILRNGRLGPGELKSGFNSLSESNVSSLGLRYKVQYVVTERAHKLRFPIIYRNPSYVLYRIMTLPRQDIVQ